MPFDRAIHDAFVDAGLTVKHVGLDFMKGEKLVAEGWHADGTPFRIVRDVVGDAASFAQRIARALVSGHAKAAAVTDADTIEKEATMSSSLSKLGQLADRVKTVKGNLESEADAVLTRIDDAEKRGEAAIAGHQKIAAAVESDVKALEDSVAQLTNGAPAGE